MMNPMEQLNEIFLNEENFAQFVETQIKETLFQEAIPNFVINCGKLNPIPSDKEKKDFINNGILLPLSIVENKISNLILKTFDHIKNRIDVVANNKEIENYIKEAVAKNTGILQNIETIKKQYPEVNLKKNFTPPSKKSFNQFIGIDFNEQAFDALNLKKLNEINLRIFKYSDMNFSDSEEIYSIIIKSTYKKILVLKNSVDALHKKKIRSKSLKHEMLLDVWEKNEFLIIQMKQKIRKFLKEDGKTWNDKTIKLYALSEVLKDIGLINKQKDQFVIARAFCNEFNITIDTQTFKAANNKNTLPHKSQFENLLGDLIPSPKINKNTNLIFGI